MKQSMGRTGRHSKRDIITMSGVPPYLFLGPYTSASRSFIDSAGITHVISISNAAPACPDHPNVQYHRLQLSGRDISSIYTATDKATEVITYTGDCGGKVLVHCFAGVSRSLTTIAAYLVSRCSMTLKDALGLPVRARPAVCSRLGFIAQLKEVEMRVRGCYSLDVSFLLGCRETRLALLAG